MKELKKTFIDTLCKYTTRIMRSSWCYWSAFGCGGRATCGWCRLTALLLGRLLGVLLFTEARSMGRAVHWSPVKPESWSGWFPLKSSPTCSCPWLHCDLQNLTRELHYSKSTCYLVRVILLTDLSSRLFFSMSRGELLVEAARNTSCVITIVGYHGDSVYRVVASIPVWVICGRFPREDPTTSRETSWTESWS
jgi:hypothetical protein